MGMIAEMHISSPPAALDYQGLKSSDAIFPKSLKTFHAAIGDAPSNRDISEQGRPLSADRSKVFTVFVADFVLLESGRFLNFNEGNLDTSNTITKTIAGGGVAIFLFAATFEAGGVSFIFRT